MKVLFVGGEEVQKFSHVPCLPELSASAAAIEVERNI
jgi:hypothetical protein